MSGSCKDCKHWDTEPLIAGFGVWGFCQIAAHRAMPKKSGLDRAYAVNLKCEDSELMTGANFGCVHFEAKD